MNKGELIEAVSSKVEFDSKKKAQDAVDAVFDVISSELSKGGEVAIAGFGTFKVSARAARQGVNPKTGEKIQIKATKVPKFKAGKTLKDSVK